MSQLHRLLPHLTIPERVQGLAFRAFLALFSGLWVFQILVPLWAVWRDEPSWSVRTGVTTLAVAFTGAYSYTIFRLYFYRRSWAFIYTASERRVLRSLVVGTAIVLVFWQGNAWALTLVFAAITIVITALPLQAFTAVFQALIVITPILLLAPVETEMLVSVLAISFVLGMITASQLRHGGEIAELIEARYAESRVAAADERLRIARDLHDVLGHTLSLITLKSELANRLIGADPARAQQEMREVERIARSAMAEVRRTVAGERQPVLTSEIDAARQLLVSADIDLQVDGDEKAFPDEIAALFAWSVREGVTNVVRHSRARRCTILLQNDRDIARLRILDDGPDTGVPGSGTGIPNLRERVKDMDGSLSFEIMPNRLGHRLCLHVPIPTDVGVE